MTLDQHSNPETARIPVRSRQQAMDWSLVLASQGIETTIQAPQEASSWALLVTALDSERAFKTLRQYHLENCDWPWRRALPWPKVEFDFSAVAWAMIMILFYWLSSRNVNFKDAGIMDSASVFSGQWWRVFTAMTLHADLGHLATNLAIGIVLLGLALGKFGTGVGLLLAWLAGAGGNLLSLFFNARPFYGLGASGMIMGALGLLAAQSITFKSHRDVPRLFTGSVAAGIMLFILFGLTPGTDLAAHAGGFACGCMIGTVVLHVPAKFSRNNSFNIGCGILSILLITSTWWLALAQK